MQCIDTFWYYSKSQVDQASIILDALVATPEEARSSIMDFVFQASRGLHAQAKG